jgi:hypothetical protein
LPWRGAHFDGPRDGYEVRVGGWSWINEVVESELSESRFTGSSAVSQVTQGPRDGFMLRWRWVRSKRRTITMMSRAGFDSRRGPVCDDVDCRNISGGIRPNHVSLPGS